MTKVRQALGQWGEELAARYLIEQGMVLLDRNWRTSAGEIDIISALSLVEIFFLERISSMPKQYPRELRERAVRLVIDHRADYETEWEAIGSIAKKLGIGSAETLRKWI